MEGIAAVPTDIEVVGILGGFTMELEAVSHPDTRASENAATAIHAPGKHSARNLVRGDRRLASSGSP